MDLRADRLWHACFGKDMDGHDGSYASENEDKYGAGSGEPVESAG
jgi:hypothetical protein